MSSLSPEFRAINRSVVDLITTHPRGGYSPYLQKAILHTDLLPDVGFRAQFSHGGERTTGKENGTGKIGRISITGVMETSLTPTPGWHVFDLLVDGTVIQKESPSDGSGQTQRVLDPEQMANLAEWLDLNRDAILTI